MLVAEHRAGGRSPSRTFSGLVVPNSYVASQTLRPRPRRAARARLDASRSRTRTACCASTSTDAARPRRCGPPALDGDGRPADDRPATTGCWRSSRRRPATPPRADLRPGGWRVEIVATAADGTAFRQSRDLRVRHDRRRPRRPAPPAPPRPSRPARAAARAGGAAAPDRAVAARRSTAPPASPASSARSLAEPGVAAARVNLTLKRAAVTVEDAPGAEARLIAALDRPRLRGPPARQRRARGDARRRRGPRPARPHRRRRLRHR